MTVFTRTWNSAYEALPPDTENAKNGAERINQTKVDTRERLEVDHSMASDTKDGTHLKVTFTDPLAAKPTAATNQGFLYTKDVSGVVELFFEDEAGNEIQLTSGGSLGLAGQAIVGTLTGNVTGNCSGSSGSTTGNAGTATAWSSSRTITISGDASGSAASNNGTNNITIALSANSVNTNELVAGAVQAETALGSIGAIGTYALCYKNTIGGIAAGATVSGSNLSYSSAGAGASTSPSGTWRCMGYLPVGGDGTSNSVSLFLRIS